jgi:GNAT superfamily N-acetyltransferase
MDSIVRFDPRKATDARHAQLHAVLARCHAESHPREPYRTPSDTRAFLEHPPQMDARSQWLALCGDVVHGIAELSATHGSTAGSVRINVDPAARRRGLGSALLAAVTSHAETSRLRTLIGHHATAAGARFAARAGFRDGRRDVRGLLELATARLEPIAVDGYRLYSWQGAVCDGLLDSYARAREAINDAPSASANDWERFDAARVRDLEQSVARRGREVRVTAALDRSGTVVAFSELRVGTRPGSVAGIEDSAVLRAHRRVGLGRMVKVESLRLLREARPDVALVTTTNAECNVPIRRLNEAIGFTPELVSTVCTVEVIPPPSCSRASS